MAGRSGAAAIEVELRDAAAGFDPRQLATRVRVSSLSDAAVLADALNVASTLTPQLIRREGEAYLAFGELSSDTPLARRIDCTALYGGAAGFGIEVHLSGDFVIGVSIYLI
eukprot:CAMPEP_0183360154 /NCGR_PEP_ID=MMETSP0164_2-20130417/54474_1 /TAXON_ID=221442 /ORGANISM="Coccolithus pelagicus ssp braarudi, Strain PLY182g" /LENGTH=110 /DNA_ID=CAMNT_0025534449 /DNA_START=39 /DNA_END=371 /DNA_ORIENTATION=-